jgi:DNA-binding MarR family transcriptional regulator
MTDAPTDPRQREIYDLAVRIGLAWRAMRRGASAAPLRDWLYSGVEQGQMDTLDVLATQATWRMSEIAEALRVDPSTATRAVDRMEKLGFAERRPGKDDGRVVEVAITDTGRTIHREVATRRVELMTEVLSAYRKSELSVLADLLERFVTATDAFVASHTP